MRAPEVCPSIDGRGGQCSLASILLHQPRLPLYDKQLVRSIWSREGLMRPVPKGA